MSTLTTHEQDACTERELNTTEQVAEQFIIVQNADGTHTGLVNGKPAHTTRRINWDEIL